ncbi:uncharacterized protein LOC129871417 [Solanum dulcamara]|uniref:uncharacterized protein LOC129871417 n=1 Tax=Solanum dulcamara TaxID=45834 RepID=UPI002485C0D8|nr:uncharacterized protein LOC129871417 [Solanum dulcamara]
MNHSKHQNTCKNPNVQQQQQQQKEMEKLREVILKLSNSEPNVPLSETQNAILQQHLNNFLSRLHITPDHPPYTWMIEKALQELNEEGGSSEDSISEFIKKEHDSLPCAHMTVLKHHLQKMTEKGEILMNDGRFLLPGDSKSVNPKRKRKRKCVKRKKKGNSEIKQKKSGQKKKEEDKQVQHDDIEVVREQKDLDEQQNDVTVDGNRGQENRIHEEYWALNEHHNEPSTDKGNAQLSGQQKDVTGTKVFSRRVLRSTVHKQKGKEQVDATEGSLQSSVDIGSGIGCNTGSVPIEPPGFMMTEEIEHLQDSELQQSQLSLSTVEETADISNLYPQEILENEQPGDDLPQLLSPEAPPGFEFLVVEDATANKAHTSSSVDLDLLKEHTSLSVGLDLPKEDCFMHQSSDRPSVEEALLKSKKQQKKHHSWQQTNRPMTRAQRKGTVTPNEQPISGRNRTQVQLAMERSSEPKQPSIENSSETDRAQRQQKRWSKNLVEPKSVSTFKVERLALCDSADQQLVLMEEPLSISKPLCASANQHLVQMEEPLALATGEEALNLTDPQHEVHLKQPKDKRRGRALKGKDDGAIPDTTLLKDVRLSKKLTKKQNDRGGGRRRNAQ